MQRIMGLSVVSSEQFQDVRLTEKYSQIHISEDKKCTEKISIGMWDQFMILESYQE
jgi:hypothetical protein